jgi:hypothetical protein
MGKQLRNQFAIVLGAVGVIAAITATAMTPALGLPSAGSPPIVSNRVNGPVTLHNSDKTLVSIKLSAGTWDISGKMWADSQAGKPTGSTVVGCSLWNGGTFLDNSAFNTPKVGGPGGSSAGVNVVNAVIRLRTTRRISFKCDDFGSMAVAHTVVLTAIG